MRRILLFLILFFSTNCFSQSYISRKNALADIDFYVKTMIESHYQPFMFIERDKYFSNLSKIKKGIQDSIDTKNLVRIFYQITSLLNDGHSTPSLSQPLFKEDYKKEQFLPVEFVTENAKLYSTVKTATQCKIPLGAEITAINNKDIPALLTQIQRGIAGNKPFSEVMSVKLLSYFLFLEEVKPPFRIQYKKANGKIESSVIEKGVDFRTALAVTMPHISKRYEYKVLGHKLAYIDFRSMGGNIDDFKIFLDSCFADFKKKNISSLAIDIRKNSGGNTIFGDLLLSYLTDKPYSWGIKKWKVSQPYKDNLKANGDTTSSYLGKANGTILTDPEHCDPQKNTFKNGDLFNGKVYLLTGPFTFSSAMAFADVVKTYKIASVIGEPTGENTQDFGEAFTFELPNSKIRIQSTSSFNLGADCNKKSNSPVIPDINVTTTLSDKIHERDKLIDYLMKEIR